MGAGSVPLWHGSLLGGTPYPPIPHPLLIVSGMMGLGTPTSKDLRAKDLLAKYSETRT